MGNRLESLILKKKIEAEDKRDKIDAEIETIKSQLKLLDDITAHDENESNRKKLTLIEMAKKILESNNGEEFKSSQIADIAINQGMWISHPDQYKASMSGTLARAAKSGNFEWLSYREDKNRVKFYKYKKPN